jgi:hypothetical protein
MAKTKVRLHRNDLAIPPPDGIAIFEREVLDPVRRDYFQARMLGLGLIADKGMATPEELAKLAELPRIWEECFAFAAKCEPWFRFAPDPHKNAFASRTCPRAASRFGTGRDRVSKSKQSGSPLVAAVGVLFWPLVLPLWPVGAGFRSPGS